MLLLAYALCYGAICKDLNGLYGKDLHVWIQGLLCATDCGASPLTSGEQRSCCSVVQLDMIGVFRVGESPSEA